MLNYDIIFMHWVDGNIKISAQVLKADYNTHL